MINQQMLDYIKQQTALGKSKEEVRQALAQAGWKEADIEEGLKAAESGAAAPLSPQPQGELPSATSIFKETWELYKQRLGVLLGVYLLPYVIIALLAAAAGGLGFMGARQSNPAFIILILVLVVAMIYVGVWSGAALIFAIKDSGEKIGVKEAYKRARGRIGALFVVGLLTALAIIGGFILLIIPGLIFIVWFSQSSYVAVLEGISGTAALSKSRQYVKGRFWPVVAKLGFIILITILGSILLGIIGNALFGGADNAPKAIFNGIINVLWAPFAAIYGYLLYTYIKSTAK